MIPEARLLAPLFCLFLGLAHPDSSRSVAESRAAPEESATEAIRARGKLIMLCFPTLAGGISPNLEHGPTRRVGGAEHFIGLEITLMHRLAQRLGVELEIRTLEKPGYAPLIPAMLQGQADLVASTLSITSARKKMVDFSQPYDFAYKVVVVPPGSPIQSRNDLAGHTAVAAEGSSHHQHLKRLGFEEQNIRLVDFVEEYYTYLADGEADFALVDSLYSDRLDELQNAPPDLGLKVAFAFPQVDEIAAALPKGSDLKQPLNRLLRELESSGELAELRQRAQKTRAGLL